MNRPRLKSFVRHVAGGEVTLVREPGVQFTFPDSEGQILALLDLLDGSRTVLDAARSMRLMWPDLTPDDIADGVALLDATGLLEDAAASTSLSVHQSERYASNLAFFSTFAHLNHSRFGYQESLRRSMVVLLGVGGIGSSLLYNLAGLGVGHVVAVDCDRVELKNLSRQFLYDEADVGKPKLDRAAARARALNSEMVVTSVERRVAGAEDIVDLLPGADLVLSVIDQPAEVQEWVNEACVSVGVPVIAGGVGVTRGAYWSVTPGTSGCLACRRPDERDTGTSVLPERTNRAIGPAAGLVGSLMALEAARYLTGFATPVSAGRLWLADLTSGQIEIGFEWGRAPGCPVCGSGRTEFAGTLVSEVQ